MPSPSPPDDQGETPLQGHPRRARLLRTLWRPGSASAKQVHEAKQAERPDLAYASVLRLMQIMHGKGLLKRDESSVRTSTPPHRPRSRRRPGCSMT